MSLSTTARRRRAGRTLAISAAAVVVCIGPTACDFAQAGLPGGSTGGHSGHDGYGASDDTTRPVVVPVGDTDEADPTTTGKTPPKTTSAAARPATDDGGATGEAPGNEDPGNEDPGATATDDAGATATDDPDATATDDAGATATDDAAATATEEPAAAAPDNNGLDVLGTDCSNSNLPPHTGFQVSPACVQSSHGEVAAEDQLPSLLITSAPDAVGVGEAFTLEVSTRNLVRDRFLGAAVGGYYLESSFLNGDGLQRGHFHTACRILPSTSEAPDSSGAPAFFLATQDNGGGETPDTVAVEVTGIDEAGTLQCTSWAGDGSHRTPMMTRANQTPAIDSVRITVQ